MNPVSLDYLHDTAVNSSEKHPSTFKTYSSILEHITIEYDHLFIGVDGLDECEKEDRRLILLLLKRIVKVSSPQTKIKIFLASQKLKDLEDSLNSTLRFDIKQHHNRQDIHHYVDKRYSQLCERFGVTLQRRVIITSNISSRCEGKTHYLDYLNTELIS